MSDFLTRLQVEQSELQEKLEKLGGFFGTPVFEKLSKENTTLLRLQYDAMNMYNNILIVRLDTLKNN